MKNLILTYTYLILLCGFGLNSYGQFDATAYKDFLKSIENIDGEELQAMHPLKDEYIKSFDSQLDIGDCSYLDTIILKLDITDSELNLLNKNQFFVTERLSHLSYGDALWKIYQNDLPVMITTDFILHALHKSYDTILKDLETYRMYPNLQTFLQSLYDNYPDFKEKYSNNAEIEQSLKDLDLYITVALSLIDDVNKMSQFNHQAEVDRVLNLIKDEQFVTTSVFSSTLLPFDCSQFKPRGHYTDTEKLEKYFRTMMWLGRAPFYLTPPPEKQFSDSEIKRINTSAFLLNEFVEASDKKELFDENDKIINKLVGESDNITPKEYGNLLSKLGINSVNDLLDNFDVYYDALQNDDEFKSRIASFPYLTDPLSEEPAELPITYKLSGQRFIIDSYIFTNLVYDRVKFRMLPDPLDVLICIGNNDAINLMQDEIEEYDYAKNLASMRYLVERKEKEYWTEGFYGTWLNSIRTLGKEQNWNKENLPAFMKTTAWQQEKINTQLAAWTQLRHDNLLYAAQSYTGSVDCCFPHSYVEPYPDFYEGVAEFAKQARIFFEESGFGSGGLVTEYYRTFEEVMGQLKILAEKELNKEEFTEEDKIFLSSMMHTENGCGGPFLTGWVTKLYYYGEGDLLDPDYITADVHTQPTDLAGNPVGKILHVGNGGIDLGVFLAPAPSNDYKMMAFVGPVSSYYQYIQGDFERSTDEDWTTKVIEGDVPERPDWVNIYLAKNDGEQRVAGRELPGVTEAEYTGLEDETTGIVWQAFPNPTKDILKIVLPVMEDSEAFIIVTDHLGKEIKTYGIPLNPNQINIHTFNLNGLNTGMYNFTILVDGKQATKQVMLVD